MWKGIDLRKADEFLQLIPKAIMVADCESFYDALARSESQGLGLSEKRTAIEVTATRQQMEATGIDCKWVNSDRQLADSLTKPIASHAIGQLCRSGILRNVFDENFEAAKKVRKKVRDAYLRSAMNRSLKVRKSPNEEWCELLEVAKD